MKRLVRKANENMGKTVYWKNGKGEHRWAGPLVVSNRVAGLGYEGDAEIDKDDPKYYIARLRLIAVQSPKALVGNIEYRYKSDPQKIVEFMKYLTSKDKDLMGMIWGNLYEDLQEEIAQSIKELPKQGFMNIGLQELKAIVVDILEKDKSPHYTANIMTLDNNGTLISVRGEHFAEPIDTVDSKRFNNGNFVYVSSPGIIPK